MCRRARRDAVTTGLQGALAWNRKRGKSLFSLLIFFFFLPIFPPAFSFVLVHTFYSIFNFSCSGNEEKKTGRVTDFYTSLLGPIPRGSINANVFYSASLYFLFPLFLASEREKL